MRTFYRHLFTLLIMMLGSSVFQDHPISSVYAVPSAQTAQWVVDPTNRAASRDFFLNQYRMESPPASNWTGSIAGCNPGTTAQAYRDAVLQRVNYFRGMVGIPPVVFDSTSNRMAQAAALMMSAKGELSHTPPSTWPCYSQDGSTGAGSSNLALGGAGWNAIDMYMDDYDSGTDFSLGHRRWILYPQTQKMGTGDVPGGQNTWAANALRVFDDQIFGPRPSVREPEGFVAWPPRGYIPYPVVYEIWSFAYPDADFSQASVTMTRGNASSVVVERGIVNDYGERAIAWKPLIDTSRPQADVAYQVSIFNVRINGVARNFSYGVTIIDLNLPPTDLRLSATTIPENQPIGKVIGTISSTDPDSTTIPTYTLVPGAGDTDNARFRIVGNALQTNEVFNYEQKQSYSIRIQASDGRADGTYAQAFTIGVENRNDPPFDIALAGQSIAENQTPPIKVGMLSSRDEDAGENFSYALVDGVGSSGNDAFQIVGNELYTRQPLDYESYRVYQVRVEVRDGGGAAFSKPLAVSVTDANDRPLFSSVPTRSVQPDQAYRYVIETHDDDVGDSRRINAETTLPSWMTLTDQGDGTALLEGQPTSSDLGNYTITLIVRDSHGVSSLQQFDVRVVNEKLLQIAGGTTSSAFSGWPSNWLIDGNRTTVWSSAAHVEHLASSDWAAVILSATTTVDRVRITPRPGPDNLSLGFPKDFVLQYARNGDGMTCDPGNAAFQQPGNWRPLLTRFGYTQPTNAAIDFTVAPQAMGCVRVLGTELSQDDYGTRFMQLAEVALFNGSTQHWLNQSVTSSAFSGWPSNWLIDGNRTTVWSSAAHVEHLASSDWAAVILSATTTVDRVRITPRPGPDNLSLGFPKDFVLQYARNGDGMTCDPGNAAFQQPGNWRPLLTRFGYTQPTNAAIDFTVAPQAMGCVRVLGTELSQDDYGTRFMQLAEVALFNGSTQHWLSQSVTSSAFSGWPSNWLIDGNRTTVWSSAAHVEHLASSDWAAVILPTTTTVDRVRITPRPGPDNLSLGFPKDFVLQYARNGDGMTCDPGNAAFQQPGNWRPLLTRFGYTQPTNAAIDFTVVPQAMGCVRVLGTELSQDDYGTRFMQLAEVALIQFE